jgi:hypothetical protein
MRRTCTVGPQLRLPLFLSTGWVQCSYSLAAYTLQCGSETSKTYRSLAIAHLHAVFSASMQGAPMRLVCQCHAKTNQAKCSELARLSA